MTFRPTRRQDKVMPAKEAEQVLARADYGVLSTVSQGGAPYGVPLSYVYVDGAIYFHSAVEGHKLDNIAAYPKVCFTVVGWQQTVKGGNTAHYKSVIVFGTANEVTARANKAEAITLLCEKYEGDFKLGEGDSLDFVKVFRIDIEHMTGKQSM